MKPKKRLNILVTAGATREPIDPVRFISNRASGALGYSIAREAVKRGHRVILISAPTALKKPHAVPLIDAATAQQMQQRLREKFDWCDCLVMTAAVSDFRVRRLARQKIKRGARKKPILELKQSPDILAALGRRKGRKMLVGFALETAALKSNARDKLRRKNLDLIVATQIKAGSYPFGEVKMDTLIIDRQGNLRQLKQAKKSRLARILLDTIEKAVLS